ncbi:MAG: CHRD domain-containing protein [Sporichthyaceae bacterium]
MRARTVGTVVAGIGVSTGLVVSSLGGVAVAGHLNTVLSAKLTGAKEVPKAGDPDGRGSISVFGIDNDTKTLCYVLRVGKISLPEGKVAGHIHQGGVNANGPIVVNLAGPAGGEAADCLTQGETLPSGAKAFPTKVTVADILKNPRDFYVNVHNVEFPDGAIRGQLRAK